MYRGFQCAICLIILFTAKLAAEVPISPFAAPASLPNVDYRMKTAGYWIAKHAHPDSIIMTSEQIQDFNHKIRIRSGAVSDIRKTSTKYSSKSLNYRIQKQFRDVRNRKYVDLQGKAFREDFWKDLESNLNLQSTGKLRQVKRALVTSLSFQRVFPTSTGCFTKVGDIEFDEWQNSALDIGTPIVCYQATLDNKWCYGASSINIGWNPLSDIAICNEKTWQDYINSPDFIVITNTKADLWLDSKETRHAGFARMGCKYPLLDQTERQLMIKLPIRNEQGNCEFITAYISKTDANIGFLSYTPRNALIQAFKLQNESYGWGDSNGDWDCSSMINRIFATFGINLPRNGGFQEKAASRICSFDSKDTSSFRTEAIVNKGIGGICLLRMEGHIMIYLGSVNGIPYALHDMWGFRTSNKPQADNVWVVNKTVVSDLSLGAGSQKGSFLDRLTSLSILNDQ